jgi:citrate/tricarballylate utilization protein
VQTYERYSWPNVFARMLRSGWIAPVVIGALVLVAIAALGGPANLVTRHIGPGAFYAVVPYLALVVPALVVSLWGLFVILAGAREFARDVALARGHSLNWAALAKATVQALNLQYLKGGGAGCYYPRRRGSSARRRLHGCVFWGFLAAFVSTTLAAIEQDVLHLLPPYEIASAPVLFGIVGGALMVVGCTGLLVLKPQSDPIPTSDSMRAMDYAFLVILDLVAITGMLTLVLRGTSLVGLVFSTHLAVLGALYVTAPYGKFVHFVYRYIALIKNAGEEPVEL